MKFIDVITLSDNAFYVMFLANKNGAVDCNLGKVDDENQNIQIKVPDDKHQAVFEVLETYLNATSTSSVVTRSSENKGSNNLQNNMETSIKGQTQGDLNSLVLIILLVCALFIMLPQLFNELLLFFKSNL